MDKCSVWIALFIAAAFAATSIGFVQGRTWARRSMAVLLMLAALFFLDMLLMSGWTGDRRGVWLMAGAISFVVYTQLFLVISALYRPEGHRDNRAA